MYFFTAIVTALAAAQAVVGSPVKARSPYAVKETHNVPRKWTKIGIPAPEHMVNLKIGLKNKRFNELERRLYEGKTMPKSFN